MVSLSLSAFVVATSWSTSIFSSAGDGEAAEAVPDKIAQQRDKSQSFIHSIRGLAASGRLNIYRLCWLVIGVRRLWSRSSISTRSTAATVMGSVWSTQIPDRRLSSANPARAIWVQLMELPRLKWWFYLRLDLRLGKQTSIVEWGRISLPALVEAPVGFAAAAGTACTSNCDGRLANGNVLARDA